MNYTILMQLLATTLQKAFVPLIMELQVSVA